MGAIPFRQGLWLPHIPNPRGLAAPSRHFERELLRYDKMLRLFPSQVEHLYRLVRVCRREARMGLQAATLHKHPDTVICVQEGVLPISGLLPWALQSPERVIRDLRARDLWLHGGSDPNKALDTLEAIMDATEQRNTARQQADAEGELDERSTAAFRWLKYGMPGFVGAPVLTPATPLPAPQAVSPPAVASPD